MNHDLRQSGVRFLKLLGQEAEAIMDAYLSGAVAEHALDAPRRDKLQHSGVFYRPAPGEALRLAPSLRSVLAEALKDERNRQINVHLGTALAAIKTKAGHYKEARHQQDMAATDAYLADLGEHVHMLVEMLRHGTRVLWSKINNEFGYVSSISAKIRENELAQAQIAELISGLEMLSFEELTAIAGDLRELRHLLVTRLHSAFAASAQELTRVQSRLIELLGRFREIQGRSRLLQGFLMHLVRQPDYEVSQHVAHRQVPSLFNLAAPLLGSAHADIHDVLHEAELLALAARIKTQAASQMPHPLPDAAPVAAGKSEVIDVAEDPIKDNVRAWFCAVVDTGARASALDYLVENDLPWDAESWLFQVIAGYEQLPDDQKQFFELDFIGELHPHYCGNYIIQDVVLWLA